MRGLSLRVIFPFFSLVLFVVAIFLGLKILHAKELTNYNLIVVSVDTLRADHMGVYGYGRDTTPHIDDWAKDATVFTNMRVQTPVTYPSFATFMTGKDSLESGILNNSFGYGGVPKGFVPIRESIPTLAEVLKANGYVNVAFTTNPSLRDDTTKIGRGFDIYGNFAESRWDTASKAVQNGVEWLKNNKNKKFFLWVHLIEPHGPYFPAGEKVCTFDSALCNSIKDKGRPYLEELEVKRRSLHMCQANGIPEEDLKLYENLYDGEIRMADELVGEIFNTVDEAEIEGKTIVVFYSDHGEGFDHNYYFAHGPVLYDSHTRVPFIVKSPDRKARKIDVNVQNVQIFPTLLDLLGVEYDSSKYHPSLYGLIKGEEESGMESRQLFYVGPGFSQYALQEGRYKFVLSPAGTSVCPPQTYREELFDIVSDPAETKNILDSNREVGLRLKRALDERIENKESVIEVLKNQSGEHNQEASRQLELLGY